MLTQLAILILPCIQAQSLSKGISDLAMQISQNIENGKPGNFLWSPYSAHSAFSQVLLGSGGKTLQELQGVLGISGSDTAGYKTLKSSLTAGNSTLKVSNILALAKGFKPLSSYTNNLTSRFGSQLKELDFNGQPGASVKQVNDLVSQATNGKIPEILSEDQVDNLTRMILVNAIYFKALWKTAFEAADTFQTTFRSPAGDIKADFMNAKIEARIKYVGDYEILELPYQDTDKAMLIVLPKNGASSENIIENIKNIDFSTVRDEIESETIVTIPKFQLHDRSYLKPLMQSLGANSLFSESADLRGISTDPLYVSEAVQDAVIEVTEEGTEAAAATAIVIGLRTAKRTRQFFADRPFVFLVYSYGQQIPLFIGKVVNPGQSESAAVRSGDLGKEEIVGSTVTTPGTQDECTGYKDNFPNALMNTKLCKMAEDTQNFDWLRQFRSVCEQSQRLHSVFQRKNCAPVWCEYARQKISIWTANSDRFCVNKDDKSCREVTNQIAAFSTLHCGDNL